MPSEADKWQKRYQREKNARIQAEKLLEEKSSQLFDANEKLEQKIVLESSKFRREEKKFTALFHSSIDGIILHTPDGIIIDVNSNACKLLKMDTSELIGIHLKTIIARESFRDAINAARAVKKIGHTRFECQLKRSDDTHLPAEVSTTQFTVDDQVILQEIIRDITERKQIEADLEKASQSAIKANEAKSLFLATMSHEIRTPLNGIIGFTDILLQENVSEEQKQHLNIIKKSGDILLNIINDILDFSRVESRQIELEQVDFSIIDCIEETLDIHAQTAATKHVELLYTIQDNMPRHLHGDAGRLKQVFLNLVSNGLKFTNEGSVIINATYPNKNTLNFTISDTGIGFDPAITSQLFQPFQQADASTTRKYGGTGLGLAICKQLIEAMGGTITAQSEPGKGAHFIINLPYIPAKQPVPPLEQSYDLSKLKNARALVIDDHPMNLEFMDAKLSKWGLDITTVSNAKEALKVLENSTTPFQIILTDMLMPDMDGLQLAQEIINKLGNATPPLILVTSSRLTGEKDTALNQGFSNIIHKPVREKELLSSLYRILTKAKTTKHNTTSTYQPTTKSNQSNNYALIVEDNSINAKLAKIIVERLGITAHIAHNGEEALEALKIKHIYDIVLMDMQMPVMDGIEATQRIRRGEAGEHYQQIPIIAMTANAQIEDQNRCLAAGMDHYLPKPINTAELEHILQKYHLT